MESAIQLLYTISTALQLPVMVVLLLFLGWCAMQGGALLREYVSLRAYRKAVGAVVKKLKAGAVEASARKELLDGLGELAGPGRALIKAARADRPDGIVLSKIVDDAQLRMEARAGTVGVGIRLGPMFGLMGTLIPMGPALTGLAGGDINVLTQNLVVAFSTTVLGLLIGGLCYVMLVIRKRWNAQDASDLDFLHDVVVGTEAQS
ncbi:MAG: MotA/TolQ/ExbB proton channel family protein [Planctomycetes bacterium]|nr:MotA/TolQ/ExbB proton channel family protein [Planctomycetota bacterium]